MKRLIIFLLALILTACSAPPPKEQLKTESINDIRYNITRYVDDEAGVVCWVYGNYEKGGLSCLPLSQTSIHR